MVRRADFSPDPAGHNKSCCVQKELQRRVWQRVESTNEKRQPLTLAKANALRSVFKESLAGGQAPGFQMWLPRPQCWRVHNSLYPVTREIYQEHHPRFVKRPPWLCTN